MNRFSFKLVNYLNLDSKLQFKLFKYVFLIEEWIRRTECKNEGHLRAVVTTNYGYSFCPRCNEMIWGLSPWKESEITSSFNDIYRYIQVKPLLSTNFIINTVS